MTHCIGVRLSYENGATRPCCWEALCDLVTALYIQCGIVLWSRVTARSSIPVEEFASGDELSYIMWRYSCCSIISV